MKAISIIGIIFSTIFLLFIAMAVTSDRRITIEEAVLFIVILGLFSLALSIFGLVNSTKAKTLVYH